MNEISIIIPTKDEQLNLTDCLESIKNQTYKNFEIIVVDNFSTDSTSEIAKKHNIRFFKQGNERSAQRNFGARKAKSENLLFIDADMQLEKNLLSELSISNYPAAIIGEIVKDGNFWVKCRKLEKELYLNSEIEAPRYFQKSTFLKVGGYDEKLYAGEDWDLANKLKKLKIKIGRTRSKIYHNEDNLNPLIAAKKKYYYGLNIAKYFTKNKSRSILKFSPLRVNYFRHVLNDPIHTFGLILLKSFEMVGLSLGLLVSIIKK